MKKICALLLCGILLLLAAGCGKKTPAASSPAGSSAGETPPAAVGELTVELPRELDTKAARAAMEKLPELLGRSGVDVTSVTLTFGTSYAATASALDSGAVRLAFLPADVFAGLCKTAVPVLADAGQAFSAGDDPASWNSGPAKRSGGLCAGTAALICAAPTEYGQNLAGRAAKGKSFTWAELEHARWGVLDRESTAGYRCAELWLEDNYEGRGLGELPSVTFYAGWEELFRAAAEGEIDLLPAAPEQRERFAAAWTADASRETEGGLRGFGRSREIYGELPAAAVTPRLYDWVAAVAPGDSVLSGQTFSDALGRALESAFDGPAERAAAIGAEHYAPVRTENLDGLRRVTGSVQP